MKDQKGFIQILAVALVILAAAAVGLYYYVGLKPKSTATVNSNIDPQYQASYQEGASGVAPINNNSDLDKASADLNASDTAQIDAELNALSSDASGF
jgi:flagellar basal body-associated protein FliL